MSKTKKLIVSVVLVVSILFAVAVPALAADGGASSYFYLRDAADDYIANNFAVYWKNDSSRLFYRSGNDIYVSFFHVSGDATVYNPNTNSLSAYEHSTCKYSNGVFVETDVDYDNLNREVFLNFDDVEILYCEKPLSIPHYDTSYKKYSISENVSKLVPNLSYSADSASFDKLLDVIQSLLPIIVPAVVGFLAFRKGWSFLKGETATA